MLQILPQNIKEQETFPLYLCQFHPPLRIYASGGHWIDPAQTHLCRVEPVTLRGRSSCPRVFPMPGHAEVAHESVVIQIRKKTRLACVRRFLLHQSVLGTRWFGFRGALAVAARCRGTYRELAGKIVLFAQECFRWLGSECLPTMVWQETDNIYCCESTIG